MAMGLVLRGGGGGGGDAFFSFTLVNFGKFWVHINNEK